MAAPIDWHQMLDLRRRLAQEPDEETMRRRYEAWERAMGGDGLSEAELDEELVQLLDKIHRAL